MPMLLLAGLTTRWLSREDVNNVLPWTGDILVLDVVDADDLW
jgi:hypothetical protein